jgi:hypothetical protein
LLSNRKGVSVTAASQLKLRFLNAVSGSVVLGSLLPTPGCNPASTKQPSELSGREAEPEHVPTLPSAREPGSARPSHATAPSTGTPSSGMASGGGSAAAPPGAATDRVPTSASNVGKRAQLTPSCGTGHGEVQCFARGSTHFNVGNVPSPTPPPKAHFDANNCQVLHEVHDSCCVAASTGPELINGECCYGFCTGVCCGRPLLVDGQARVARVTARADWCAQSELDVAALDPAERAELARAWLEDAQLEHASIASFARFMLDLLAFGAPAELVERCQRAMADEVQHARVCFGLASAYAGVALGPARLDTSGVTPSLSLAAAAAAAVREGCINETVAAVTATEQARAAAQPELRSILERIASDEADHAELAWRFVDWAMRQGGEPVRAAVAWELRRPAFRASPRQEPETASSTGSGRLSRAQHEALEELSWTEVILPCAAALSA